MTPDEKANLECRVVDLKRELANSDERIFNFLSRIGFKIDPQVDWQERRIRMTAELEQLTNIIKTAEGG
jgi:hypothetical protein